MPKKVWGTGQVVTAAALNSLENRIENSILYQSNQPESDQENKLWIPSEAASDDIQVYTKKEIDEKILPLIFAQDFNSANTYARNDIVRNAGKMYKCAVSAIGANTPWSAQNWEEITLSSLVES